MDRMTVRADFLRAALGIRRVSPGVTVEICPTPDPVRKVDGLRVGFTATRKIGNAVTRNRAKRRLRAAAAAVLPLCGLPGTDYVLVARPATANKPFDGLIADLAGAVRAAHERLGRAGDTP